MTQTATDPNRKETFKRFDDALDALESRLNRVFAEDGADSASEAEIAIAALQEQIRVLTEERDQLLGDLDAERARVRRLKAANDEVSGRLEAVTGTLKDMIPAVAG